MHSTFVAALSTAVRKWNQSRWGHRTMTLVYADALRKPIVLHTNLKCNKTEFLACLRGMETRGADEAQRAKFWG